ncbi:MAG: Gfo/Idh/MocA family oxidoreductase [Pseudomonadota bacterium]
MSSVMPVDAAIIGLGRWGQNLVSAVADDANTSLKFTRAMTRTPAKSSDFCQRYAIPVTDDYSSILADPAIEAVVLATPHSQHCQQICDAAAAGKHVFVEKPLALTLADARIALEASKRHRIALAVGFNRRFLPAYQMMERELAAGSLGTALHLEGNFSGPFGYGYSDDMWRGSAAENPAGGMAAMGIHVLDAMIHLCGPVGRVSAISKRQVLETSIDDTTTVQLEFEGGATGSLASLMATPSHWRLQLFGSSGLALMPDQDTLEIRRLEGAPQRRGFDATNTLALELDAFAKQIRGLATYPVTGPEAVAGVAAMEAISISAGRGGDHIDVTNIS